MNPEIKQQWLSSLKSGEYRQGRYCLKTADRYCCLGVLCDIYLGESGGAWDCDGLGRRAIISTRSSIPAWVALWAGLSDKERQDTIPALAKMNDSNHSFEQIAAKIDEDL